MERDDEEEEEEFPINFRESSLFTMDQIKGSNSTRILSFNAQSMNNKFQKIRDACQVIKPTVLALQETWGKNSSTDYSIRGYNKPDIVARKGNMNAGGGVGVWVRNGTDFEVIDSPFIEKLIETQTILLPDLNLCIINVYRPFGDKDMFINKITTHVEGILEREKDTDIVMVGDINIDLLSDSSNREKLLDATIQLGLLQQVTLPTRVTETTESLIDHVYTRSKRSLVTDVISSDISDHYLTLTSYPKDNPRKDKTSITKRWLTLDHYPMVKTLLANENWDCMEAMTLDNATAYLSGRIREALDIVAPVETRKMGKKPFNQWTTAGLQVSLKQSNVLYKEYRKSPTPSNRQKYKDYKRKLEELIRIAKSDYYDIILEEAGGDTRRLWGVLNELIDRKQCRHNMPNRFIIDGKSVRDKKNIAQAFNSYFCSIGTEMADALPDVPGYEKYLEKSAWRSFELHEVTEESVSNIMKGQQPKLSCGIDTINNKVVKTCSEELAKPMTIVINKSIRESKVPSLHKKARIIPLYKKGAANECGNYRPVSLLSALSKILEKAVCSQLMDFLSTSSILCDNQYGFRPKNQTTHAVQHMMNIITEASTQDKVTIATYIDLSKAFDCLQYDKLFNKLHHIGFTESTLNWFKDYLTGRQQCVDLDGEVSPWLDVKLGVPQGSILGPILFLLYVNDINKCNEHAEYTKFADDTTILTTGSTIESATAKMNKSLERADLWFKRNKLNLNPSKTRYMIFNSKTEETKLVKIGDTYIDRVWSKGKEQSFKLVGIHVDEKLKWDKHIHYIARKMDWALYGLNKVNKQLTSSNKKLLYSGLIHSHLVFGLPIWGCATQGRLNVLLTKQKKAIRKIFNLKYREHTLPFFLEAGILRLPELVKHTTMCYIHSGLSRHSPLHIHNLWRLREVNRENLRDRGKKLDYTLSQKQYINALPPIAQAKLWNLNEIETGVEPVTFKNNSKFQYMIEYDQQIRREPELYKEYLDKKKNQEKNVEEAAKLKEDCNIL